MQNLAHAHERASVNKCLLELQTLLFCRHGHSFLHGDLYAQPPQRMCFKPMRVTKNEALVSEKQEETFLPIYRKREEINIFTHSSATSSFISSGPTRGTSSSWNQNMIIRSCRTAFNPKTTIHKQCLLGKLEIAFTE